MIEPTGKRINASYPNPINYTPSPVDGEAATKVSAHLKGIDNKLALPADMLSPQVYSDVAITGTIALTNSAFGKWHYCTTPAAVYTITLPAVAGNAGKWIGFRMGVNTYQVALDGSGAEIIDCESGSVIKIYCCSKNTTVLYCDGTKWVEVLPNRFVGPGMVLRIDITSAATATDIQAELDACPKHVVSNGYIYFQCADGTYTMNGNILIHGFHGGGSFYFYGNQGAESEQVLHTNQAVYFDFSGQNCNGFYIIANTFGSIKFSNLKVITKTDAIARSPIYAANNMCQVSVFGCYLLGTNDANGYGLNALGTSIVYLRSVYFSSIYGGVNFNQSNGCVDNCASTGTLPKYGCISVYGSVMSRSGSPIAGSLGSDFTNTTGGIISIGSAVYYVDLDETMTAAQMQVRLDNIPRLPIEQNVVIRFKNTTAHYFNGTTDNISGNGALATVTLGTHGYASSDTVSIDGTTNFDGEYVITVTDGNTFTFAHAYNGNETPPTTAICRKPIVMSTGLTLNDKVNSLNLCGYKDDWSRETGYGTLHKNQRVYLKFTSGNGITFTGCSRIIVQDLKIGVADATLNQGILAQDSQSMQVAGCNLLASGTTNITIGISVVRGQGYCANNYVSNCYYGIGAGYNGYASSQYNYALTSAGYGNNIYGLIAYNTGSILKDGGQPTGSTAAEFITGGGLILDSSDNLLRTNVAAQISALAEKTTLADNDNFVEEDSAASNAKKRVKASTVLKYTKLKTVLAVTNGVGSPYAITDQQSGTVFTNEGAAAKVYATLPSAVANLNYTFYVQDADGLRVTAAAGDTIRLYDQVSAAAGYCESVAVGSAVKLVAINAIEWVAVPAPLGSWSVV